MTNAAKETYTTRLGCDNCGHADIYTLPLESIITNFDAEEGDRSSYKILGSDRQFSIKCEHCNLPHLRVLWWKEEEVEVPKNG